MRKTGLPERDEMVVCEITKINPNSAFAKLLEYDRSGMIHVSEVAKRWVKNIREFVKERQLVVCKVLRVDNDYISLSLKRVNKNQGDRRLQEFKREKNAEKFLEQIGKQFRMKLDEAYDAVGYDLEDKFGSLYKTFEIAVKNPDLLAEKGIEKRWADAIIEIARKNFVEKTYGVKARVTLTSFAGNGLKTIRDALMDTEKSGLNVQYISAPKYMIAGKGKDIGKVREQVEKACQTLVSSVKNSGGEGSFTIEGKS